MKGIMGRTGRQKGTLVTEHLYEARGREEIGGKKGLIIVSI